MVSFCDYPLRDWRGEPDTCARTAQRHIGGLNLCWQHARAIEIDLGIPNLHEQIEELRATLADKALRDAWFRQDRIEKEPGRSVVYFAVVPYAAPGHPHYGLVKIGTALIYTVERRMRDLATDLLGTIPGGRSTERGIHERFDHLLRYRREWFEPAPDLLTYIMEVA